VPTVVVEEQVFGAIHHQIFYFYVLCACPGQGNQILDLSEHSSVVRMKGCVVRIEGGVVKKGKLVVKTLKTVVKTSKVLDVCISLY
jgi:hypothetical protein